MSSLKSNFKTQVLLACMRSDWEVERITIDDPDEISA